jgi:hypothetical protein
MEAARSSETLVSCHSATRRHNLKMEAAMSSETLVSYHKIAWRQKPAELNLNLSRRENLKSLNDSVFHF